MDQWDLGIPRDQLPRRHFLGMPLSTSEPYGHRPMQPYEGLVSQLLSRGAAIPGAPGTCRACHHPLVWHQHRTRYKPCEVRQGCACRNFTHEEPR